MTNIEKDRLLEVLFFLYFNNKNTKMIGSKNFWNAILNVCVLYNIDNISISKAVRILTAVENRPNEREIYYLLNKLGLSVRPINKISGIYWQKQVKYTKEFEEGNLPKIRNRVLDVVMKRSIRDFIFAIYDFIGIFNCIDLKILEDKI